MADWITAHASQLQTWVTLASFACVALWETFAERRPASTTYRSRWFDNVALAILGAAAIRLCFPLAAFAFAALVQQHGWGLFNQVALPAWLTCTLGVVIVDAAVYGQHRLFHAVPILWRFHKVHHSDVDVDCGTTLRHHPVESLLGLAFDFALIAALGLPPLAILAATLLILATSIFNHGNVTMSERVDRALRRFVVTPDMHRIHHSTDIVEGNTNFSMLFPWWDHLFSTYRQAPRLGHERMLLGISEAPHASDVTLLKALAMPFRRPATPPGYPAAT